MKIRITGKSQPEVWVCSLHQNLGNTGAAIYMEEGLRATFYYCSGRQETLTECELEIFFQYTKKIVIKKGNEIIVTLKTPEERQITFK